MSDDERTKVRSSPASPERTVEVARQLGMHVAEVAVFDNVDGEYARTKDGHRLLLLDGGAVVWYGDKAPNPTYELVVPSVVLDESDEPEPGEPAAGAAGPPGGPPPRHGTGSGKDAWAVYAAEHAVAVPEGATRDQIIQALDEANIPTE